MVKGDFGQGFDVCVSLFDEANPAIITCMMAVTSLSLFSLSLFSLTLANDNDRPR